MKKERRNDNFTIAVIVFCALAIIACGAYLIYNYWYLPNKIEKQNKKYEKMYVEPSQTPTEAATLNPTAAPTLAPTAVPTAVPTIAPTKMPTAEATSTAQIGDVRLGTPDANTLIIEAPTCPPVMDSFTDLLKENSETIGYLRVGDIISLPVVQRINDNEHYLDHDFSGEKSIAGCLFLDGDNRIFPSDQCLMIYGHNMKNGTMFGSLPNMSLANVLKDNAITYFDTLYEKRAYVPFSCFTLSADEGNNEFVDIRAFQFTDSQFDKYVESLTKRSILSIPISIDSGDEILLLITCNYSISDGRFVLALRRVREGESEADLSALVRSAR